MTIDTSLLKELRERTGAGIMDCKKALEENNSDLEKAALWLREKGIAKAVKKASRISAEGIIDIVTKGNKALMFELNCETDFVAKNEKYLNFVKELGQVLIDSDAHCTDCAMEVVNAKGETVKEMVLGFIAVIGENITLRNVKVIEKNDNQQFGVYKHNGGKIAVISVLEGADETVSKQLSMHVCANAPQYLDVTCVDKAYVENERALIVKEATEQNPNKPANIIEKMVEGRLSKELKAVCLMDQAFLIDPSQTVSQFISSKGVKVLSFVRLVAGEGIEKKENNFVEEVMSQIK